MSSTSNEGPEGALDNENQDTTKESGLKNTPISLYSLPLELIIDILGYADPGTLRTVASVSPFLNYIINDDQVWRNIFLRSLCSNDSFDLSKVPGKRKSSKYSVNKDIISANNRILKSFPSISRSNLWKNEYKVRSQYLKKIRAVGIRFSRAKSSNHRKQNPFFLTSVYQISLDFQDKIVQMNCDFAQDDFVVLGSSNMASFMSLRQGKFKYQVDSYINGNLITEHLGRQSHVVTTSVLTRRFLALANSVGVIFLKNFTSEYFTIDSSTNQKYFNRHNVVDIPVFANLSPQQRINFLKRLQISSLVVNPASDTVIKHSKDTLDLVSGDLMGYVYGWNLVSRRRMFRVDINDAVEPRFRPYDGVHFPVVRLHSNFKDCVVVESVNRNFFVVSIVDGSSNVKHVRIEPDNEWASLPLWEYFDINCTHQLSPSLFDAILTSSAILDVDYGDKRMYFGENGIYVVGFDGTVSNVDSSLPDGSASSSIETVIQTKLLLANEGPSTSSLHVALFDSGKVVVHGPKNKPLVFKVVPIFLQDLATKVVPITQFDCNSVVIVLCSYNGWMAIVNILNGDVLKVLQIVKPNSMTISGRYLTSEVEEGYLIPATAVQLDALNSMSAHEPLPGVLLRGIVVLDHIAQYFQVSFDNNINVKTKVTEEDFLARKELRSRKKASKQQTRLETAEKMMEQLHIYENEKQRQHELGKLFDKYNGASDMTEEEELMLAMAMSESAMLSEHQLELEQENMLKLAFEEMMEEEHAKERESATETRENDELAMALKVSMEQETARGKKNIVDDFDDDLQRAIELSKLSAEERPAFSEVNDYGEGSSLSKGPFESQKVQKVQKLQQKAPISKGYRGSKKAKYKPLDLGESSANEEELEAKELEELERVLRLSQLEQ